MIKLSGASLSIYGCAMLRSRRLVLFYDGDERIDLEGSIRTYVGVCCIAPVVVVLDCNNVAMEEKLNGKGKTTNVGPRVVGSWPTARVYA